MAFTGSLCFNDYAVFHITVQLNTVYLCVQQALAILLSIRLDCGSELGLGLARTQTRGLWLVFDDSRQKNALIWLTPFSLN